MFMRSSMFAIAVVMTGATVLAQDNAGPATGAGQAAAAGQANAAAASGAVQPDGSGSPAPVENQDGKYFDDDGDPTFNIAADGTVDWYAFSGYRRYHAECHVCHGPDGEGSTYAPGLKESLQRISYTDFVDVVTNGRQHGNLVMPAFGTNMNVMCYIDDIYVYLRARSHEAVARGRPAKKADKPEAAREAEASCMG
jgi:methanol metabolism-related c-type cytochrome